MKTGRFRIPSAAERGGNFRHINTAFGIQTDVKSATPVLIFCTQSVIHGHMMSVAKKMMFFTLAGEPQEPKVSVMHFRIILFVTVERARLILTSFFLSTLITFYGKAEDLDSSFLLVFTLIMAQGR